MHLRLNAVEVRRVAKSGLSEFRQLRDLRQVTFIDLGLGGRCNLDVLPIIVLLRANL